MSENIEWLLLVFAGAFHLLGLGCLVVADLFGVGAFEVGGYILIILSVVNIFSYILIVDRRLKSR